MGQETNEDASCETNDNHNPLRMRSVYKTLGLGWVLSAVIFVTKFYFISLHSYSLLIFHPLVWIFIFCVTFIQYRFAAELEISKPTWGQYLGRILSGALFLCILFVILFFIEQLILLCVRHASEFLILRGYVSLRVLIQEEMFHENNEFNSIAIPSYGFLLGVVTFALLRYPYALVAFGLCVFIPSYNLLNALTIGILYETPAFMLDTHKMGIAILYLPIGFGIGLILVGIRAIISSRKLSIEDSQR